MAFHLYLKEATTTKKALYSYTRLLDEIGLNELGCFNQLTLHSILGYAHPKGNFVMAHSFGAAEIENALAFWR